MDNRINGVKIISANENISEGSKSIILEYVLEGMAEYYSAELAEKVSRGMKENALKCKYNGGSVPLGYYIDESKHFQIDSSVAPFVVECFEHYADGMTMKQLRDELNMKGVKNSRGGKLSIDVISRMLTNRKYLGEYTFQDITIKDGIPAIVSTSLFEKVQDRLTKTKKAPSSHKADDDYILTTKLFCGKCKSFMVGESGTNAQGKKYRYYKCVNHKKHQGCDMKSIRKDLIENMTIKYIREFLNDEDLINTLIDLAYDAQHKENEQLPLLRKQLAQTEKGIKNIVDAIEQGISTKSTRERLLDLEQRKNDIEMSISKESIENPMLTKKQFKFWFDQLKKLDISKSEQRQKLVDLFVNSGTADCESLQNIYGPKVEANQTDLAYLKKVIDIMKMMRCTESEAYQQAAFYVYKIEPSADAATGCAYQAFKKGDIDGAVKFFDEAIGLETDNVKKAEKAYAAGAVLASAKKLSQARAYCQKAIGFNENYGAPYILIANLYAMSPNWSDESALNKCTYFAVIDKLQRAKQVDPSVAEEANKLIGRYSGHTPQAKDLFMLGYKQGDRITIGGWIGETTTIR